MNHTPEPWSVGEDVCPAEPCSRGRANTERIVACVNALAGIKDPAAYRAKADAAIALADSIDPHNPVLPLCNYADYLAAREKEQSMNLPTIIDRLQKCCPGWKPPRLSQLVEPWRKEAIILASVKEWLIGERYYFESRFTPDVTHLVRVGDDDADTEGKTELEAFTAALEARSKA